MNIICVLIINFDLINSIINSIDSIDYLRFDKNYQIVVYLQLFHIQILPKLRFTTYNIPGLPPVKVHNNTIN